MLYFLEGNHGPLYWDVFPFSSFPSVLVLLISIMFPTHSPQYSVLSGYELQFPRFPRALTASVFSSNTVLSIPHRQAGYSLCAFEAPLSLTWDTWQWISLAPWGFRRSQDGQDPAAFCLLSLPQFLIPWGSCRFNYTHLHETILSLYCI